MDKQSTDKSNSSGNQIERAVAAQPCHSNCTNDRSEDLRSDNGNVNHAKISTVIAGRRQYLSDQCLIHGHVGAVTQPENHRRNQ